MTISEAQARLPKEYRIATERCVSWWRAIVRNDLGQPWGIGEDDDMGTAIAKAVKSFEERER